jgi:hypothetical protein
MNNMKRARRRPRERYCLPVSAATKTNELKYVRDGLEANLLFRTSLRDHLERYLRIRGHDAEALSETRFPRSSLFFVSFQGTEADQTELAEWLDTYYDLMTHVTFTLARVDYKALVSRLDAKLFQKAVRVERFAFGRRYELRTTRDTARGLADHLDAAGRDSSAVRLALAASPRRSR